jgi:hypothetical protein
MPPDVETADWEERNSETATAAIFPFCFVVMCDVGSVQGRIESLLHAATVYGDVRRFQFEMIEFLGDFCSRLLLATSKLFAQGN